MYTTRPPVGAQIDRGHPLAQGLVGYWLFNENSGGTVYDISGYGNHGTLTNGPTWVAGADGAALNYAGTSYVSVAALRWLAVTNSFTFMWYGCIADATRNAYLYGRDNGDPNYQHAIIAGFVDNYVEFFAVGYTGTDPRPGSQLAIADTTNSHQYTYTYDGTTWAGYVDGAAVFGAVRTFSLAATTSNVRCAIMSASSGANAEMGTTERFAVYSRALSGDEIAHLYAEPYAPVWQPGARRYFFFGAAVGGLPILGNTLGRIGPSMAGVR